MKAVPLQDVHLLNSPVRRLRRAWPTLAALWLTCAAAAETVTRPRESDFLAALASGDVSLNYSGTLLLSTQQTITVDTVIRDLSGTSLIGGSGTNSLFRINPNITLRLENVTLTNGIASGTSPAASPAGRNGTNGTDAAGGAVYVDQGGRLIAVGSKFARHQAQGGDGGTGGPASDFGSPGGRGGRGGRALGGAIYSQGEVILTNCLFTNCLAQAGMGGAGGGGAGFEDGGDGGDGAQALGGAIYSGTNATLTLRGCMFSSNTATGSVAGVAGTNAGAFYDSGVPGLSGAGRGGAVAAEGSPLDLQDCAFEDNFAEGANGVGGPAGAADQGAATGRNGAGGSGGALFADGSTHFLLRCVFTENAATSGSGGTGGLSFRGDGGSGGNGANALGGALAFANLAQASVLECSFDGNGSYAGAGAPGALGSGAGLPYDGADGDAGTALGGAIHSSSGTVVLVGSTLANNRCAASEGVEGAPGSQGANGSPGKPGGAAAGGGLYLAGGGLYVTNSTFHANLCTGGTGGAGGAGDSTGLYGTDGGKGGAGGRADGAGLYLASTSAVWLVHCTLATNVTMGGPGGAGGAKGDQFAKDGAKGSTGGAAGGGIYGGPQVHLQNTLLAYSGTASNAFGKLTDEGGNLSSDSTPTLGPLSYPATNPQLGSLLSNGGPTRTAMPGTNCLDRALTLTPPLLVDQRGVYRTDAPDIGAVEIDGVPHLEWTPGTNQIVLSWPATEPPFELQHATNLPDWFTLTTPTNAGGIFSVTNSTSLPRRFYRLKR